jgi:hypothetical protein
MLLIDLILVATINVSRLVNEANASESFFLAQ